MQQTVTMPIPGIENINLTAGQGSVLGAILIAVAALSFTARRASKDRLEIRRDSKEGQLLEIVLKERNDAMESAKRAWDMRSEDAGRIGHLSAQVEGLTALNHKLTNEVQVLKSLNEKLNDEMAGMREEMHGMHQQMKEFFQQQQQQQRGGTP